MSRYFCLIPYHDRVLLLEEEVGWTLPHTEHEGFYDDTKGWFHLHLQREMQRQFGLYTTTLRPLTADVCHMELHKPPQPVPGVAIWADRNDLANLTLAVPEHRTALEAWFSSPENIEPLTAPWEQPGWFEQAATWIHKQVAQLGYVALGEVEQVKVFVFGTVLRLQTGSGKLYFKALLPTVQNEPALILELSKAWKVYVPQLVAYDLEQRWMLMRDFGGETFTDFGSDRYESVVRTYARMQLGYASSPEKWVRLGCPDRRLERLPSLMTDVIAAAHTGDVRLTAGLTQKQLAKLPSVLPTFREKLQQLGAFGVPATLVQQDFQWGNVAMRKSGFVLFDWQDTVVSHPFFSMARFLDYVPIERGVEPFSSRLEHPADIRRRSLRDAYLEPWRDVANMDTLQEAFALTRELQLAYLAVRWFANLSLFHSAEDESVAWALGQLLGD